MSLIASAFDATGSYLATCIAAVDVHRLRVQAVDPMSGNQLAVNFSLEKHLQVQSIQWGLFSNASTRKIEEQYIAICLNNGNILIYSPVQDEVVYTLESQSGSAALVFHHSRLTKTAFSLDMSGTITEWDMSSYTILRHFTIAHLSSNNNEQLGQLTTVMHANKVHLLVSSYSIFLVSLDDANEVVQTYPGHVTPIHTLLPISEELFMTAANNDRFINVYSISTSQVERVLVAQSNVSSISYGEYDSNKVLIAVTEEDVELFNDPLAAPQNLSKFSKKKKVKSKSKNSDASITISRPAHNPTNEQIKINTTCTVENQFTITWLEVNTASSFDTLVWCDDQGYKYTGKTQLIKTKPSFISQDHSLHGVDVASSKQYNEGNAIVQTGDNFKDLEDGEEEESLAERAAKLSGLDTQQPKEKKKWATAGSLTTVLTQAIKSNDHSLLETVLNNKDEEVIKNTVKKLSTNYVIALLNRISERIARNSTKQSILNVWIKWLFIIHGGFLNNYSSLAKNLGILHTTLHRRSLTLGRLLELNGKIDMVLENMELKKLIIKSNGLNEDLSENESDVEYIEELEDNDSELVDEDEDDLDDYIESDDDADIVEAGEDPMDIDQDGDDDGDDDEDNYSDEELGVVALNPDAEEEDQ